MVMIFLPLGQDWNAKANKILTFVFSVSRMKKRDL